jgi:O-acetyl-ADP-ribose deacetylase (regulator of RNase III)
MGSYKEISGDLVELAKQGMFDVVAHGCNCFCTMGAGIAPLMDKAFSAGQFPMERPTEKGNLKKLGNIDVGSTYIHPDGRSISYTHHRLDHRRLQEGFKHVEIVNCYTQYDFGVHKKPLSYAALELCLHKMNYEFKGKHIGLPQIGCGLAGGNWERVKKIIQETLTLCNVTVVIYKS